MDTFENLGMEVGDEVKIVLRRVDHNRYSAAVMKNDEILVEMTAVEKVWNGFYEVVKRYVLPELVSPPVPVAVAKATTNKGVL